MMHGAEWPEAILPSCPPLAQEGDPLGAAPEVAPLPSDLVAAWQAHNAEQFGEARRSGNLQRLLLTGPKAERQRQRQQEGIAMAKGLSGAAVMNYRPDKVDGRPVLLDTETGEIIEAGPGEARALRFAIMHLLGADPANHAVGVVTEVHEDGREEIHEEAAAQTRHSSRLNTNYIEAQRRRNRGNARKAKRRLMGSMNNKEWFQYRSGRLHGRYAETLLTLTLPPVEAMTFLLEIQRFNRAFTLMRKREDWKARVRGGYKGVEVKLSAMSDTELYALGGEIKLHAHGHLLLLMKWWDWMDLRLAWLDCVIQATRDTYGIELDRDELLEKVEGGVVVDLRRVKNEFQAGDPDANGKVWTHDEALAETLKYITKPDDWMQLVSAGQVGRELLLEIESVERWPRMFELLGKARDEKASPLDPATAEGGRAFVHTACVNDGTAQAPDEAHPLDGSIPGLLPQQTAPKGGPEEAPEDSRGPPKAPRPPSWRQLMDTLPLGEWVAVMVARMTSARRYIARLILETRGGIWFTLDGRPLGAGEPERTGEPLRRAPRLLLAQDPMGDLWAGMDLA